MLIPPQFNTQNQDMSHGTIGSELIEIQSQPYCNFSPTLIESNMMPYNLPIGS